VLALTEKMTFVMIEHSVSRSRSSHPMIPGLRGAPVFCSPAPPNFSGGLHGFNFNF
jgi:hypothetical protein